MPGAIPVAERDSDWLVLQAGLRHDPLQPELLSQLQVGLFTLAVGQE